MTDSEENLDDILRRGLQSRFDKEEAEVKPGLYKSIYDRLHPDKNTAVWYLLGAVLLIAWVVGGSITRKYRAVLRPSAQQLDKQASVSPMKQTGIIESAERNVLPDSSLHATLRSEANQQHFVYPKHPRPDVHQGNSRELGSDLIEAEAIEQLLVPDMPEGPAQSDEIIREPAILGIASLHPVGIKPYPVLLKLPSVFVVADTGFRGNTYTQGDIKWIFLANSSQTFLTLDARPSQGLYQNFRFAPIWSAKSKAVRIAAGIEKNDIQILAGYTYRRNWIYYELGTEEFDIRPDGKNGYQVRRKGMAQMYDEAIHTAGVGINKVTHFKTGFFRDYEAITGIQYQTTLHKDSQHFLSVNASLSRQIRIGDRSVISIGPFIEYGLNRQRISGLDWQYRPYQFGVSLMNKLNHLKTNK
ncbi:MAG: hypothetical protein J7619_07665 [Dyadobacter sp.]|uniref:hypothetical protein n=1 Tax=Dyadobacter sp. TaxID=1914288 RepID=UPI001B0C49E2|nr:hypothetical protein [Dyadobacter sp.]MBO9612555.1 hypothetical protein [Dyadobacter sp.]